MPNSQHANSASTKFPKTRKDANVATCYPGEYRGGCQPEGDANLSGSKYADIRKFWNAFGKCMVQAQPVAER